MKADPQTEAELIAVLEAFCSAMARRDLEGVTQLFSLDPDIVVVTSEQPLLRGSGELRDFLERYVQGSTTYSWSWDKYDASISDSVGWLLAQGTETASSPENKERHPYRMTLVLGKQERGWLLFHVHGSSPT